MVPNITRSQEPWVRLVRYLLGPGKSNEHTEPHMVAGNTLANVVHANEVLDPRRDSMEIARELGFANKVHPEETVGGGHVWHCSLSLGVEDGALGDQAWSEIAERFVSEMGFSVDQHDWNHAWIAVHHGNSANGNDHIHIAVNLLGKDGSKIYPRFDKRNAQRICRDIERDYGLRELGVNGRSTPGWQRGEAEAETTRRAMVQASEQGIDFYALDTASKAELLGRHTVTEQPRVTMARIVRGCATSSRTEDEFVRRLRHQGLVVRPRFAVGTVDEVTGYAVAFRPALGEKPAWWYQGSKLGHDLSLPRLRETWPSGFDYDKAASAEWTAAFKRVRVANPAGPETAMAPTTPFELLRHLVSVQHYAAQHIWDDHTAWSRIAHELSGSITQLADALPVDQRDGLNELADLYAKSAGYKRPSQPPSSNVRPPTAIAGLMISAALLGKDAQSKMLQAIVLKQLVGLSQTLADMHSALNDERLATQLRETTSRELHTLLNQLQNAGHPVGTATTTWQAESSEETEVPQPSGDTGLNQDAETVQTAQTSGEQPSVGHRLGESAGRELLEAIAYLEDHDPLAVDSYDNERVFADENTKRWMDLKIINRYRQALKKEQDQVALETQIAAMSDQEFEDQLLFGAFDPMIPSLVDTTSTSRTQQPLPENEPASTNHQLEI